MIEKLKRPVKIGGTTFREKINELVDAVNELQKQIVEANKKIADRMIGCTTLDIPESYKTDPYAEQRKWIGKLCKFWDDQDEGYLYEILMGITDTGGYPYITKEGYTYGHCEPVSEDLIYKKENEYTYQEIIIGDMHENKGE